MSQIIDLEKRCKEGDIRVYNNCTIDNWNLKRRQNFFNKREKRIQYLINYYKNKVKERENAYLTLLNDMRYRDKEDARLLLKEKKELENQILDLQAKIVDTEKDLINDKKEVLSNNLEMKRKIDLVKNNQYDKEIAIVQKYSEYLDKKINQILQEIDNTKKDLYTYDNKLQENFVSFNEYRRGPTKGTQINPYIVRPGDNSDGFDNRFMFEYPMPDSSPIYASGGLIEL